ncbi:MAG TPA: citrate/2-methylcitrate synthase [Thermoplasmataceae archaeon]|nr:citrate/2-methylcitrate synthase [Thermoplasmataceae archaeon]
MNEAGPVVAFSRGLEGVVAAETKIGYVDGQEGRLVYRGFNIETLVENSNYEEVAYLLLYGNLPTQKQLDEFVSRLRDLRPIDPQLYEIIKKIAPSTHPMNTLRTAVSYLGSLDPMSTEPNVEQQEEIGINLIAKMPTIVGAIARAHSKLKFVDPDPTLPYASDFFEQSLGRKPSKEEAKMLDAALILHADHGMNASTFAAMLTISTLSDMYSAVTSAVAALKGPLHGGANERALALIQKIGTPDRAEEVISDMIERKEKIMGFGHRVYKVYDPRAKILKKYAEAVTRQNKTENLFKTANRIEEVMISKLGTKGIFPNVDFYSGMLYYSIGFKPDMFTPIFAVGRITGWVARALEYVRDNRLFRPKAQYIGDKGPREYVPISQR